MRLPTFSPVALQTLHIGAGGMGGIHWGAESAGMCMMFIKLGLMCGFLFLDGLRNLRILLNLQISQVLNSYFP